MTIGQVISKYGDNEKYITSYYTIHDTLYDNDMDLSMNEHEDFTFTAGSRTPLNITEIGSSKKYKLNPANLFDSLKTYYTTETTTTTSGPSPIIVDVTPEGEISLRDNTGDTVTYNSTDTPIYSQICRLEADAAYDSKKHYYRVNSFGHNQNTNYTIKDNVIVFNNIQSTNTPISVHYTKYTRKHDKDKKYFHGAEDGLFMHENKKRSVANAMNEDIKVMIRQNEQMMVLGGITLATLVVGAYVILRN
jgi:hypothetical protein